MGNKIGIYPGSFNPFHIGHYDIALKAERVFDKIIVAQGINPAKSEEKAPDLNLPFRVMRYSCSLAQLYTNFVLWEPKDTYFIVRGLRNGYDLGYEEVLRKTVEDMVSPEVSPKIQFAYFFCNRAFEHISSSTIRQLMKSGEDVSKYLYVYKK